MSSSSLDGLQSPALQADGAVTDPKSQMPLAARLAALQLTMAANKKTEANEMIQDIQAENQIIRNARNVLAQMREQMSKAEEKKGDNPSAAIKNFCKQYNIPLPEEDSKKGTNKGKWEILIKNMEGFIESRGMDTQTRMVQLEDLMGKYNSWTQGAGKTYSDFNQLLQSILTR